MKTFTEEEYVPFENEHLVYDSEDIAWDHVMDISGSIYARLAELDMSQGDLAKALGVTPGRISQIIKGYPGMTIKTLAKIEAALEFDLGSGFSYTPKNEPSSISSTVNLPGNDIRKTNESWSKSTDIKYGLQVIPGGLAA